MNAAERVYVSSASDGEITSRLAEELARRIEDDIVSRDLAPGGALGSLRELGQRYSVGRSVAREALGLLERRGLGKLRPGPCGGFIFARPQPDTIGEQLADYFRATGVRLHQLLDAREAVDLAAARAAAAGRIESAHLARLEAAGETADLAGVLAARLQIARLAAQPVLLMFVECLNSLTLDFAGADVQRPAHARPAIVTLARALRAGDVNAAIDASRRAHEELTARLAAQASPGPPGMPASRLPAPGETLAASIARTLAAEILKTSRAGTRLGSEWDLCERFNVSRLTLRQAVRLLQDSGLIDCRRGRGKGLVVRERRAPT